ncbi:carboxypeptidase-like regulatory domain-containing protein [Chryseobacterium polytrichastri]|uniref:CarboxypepD_reg-like domain-containing protein n=1 Tax=Chryseobacterium polytrichastri TaxID=1302687 RepID=A0A1M6QVJ8_9FLAO|nr:carboxypeptidase-like regulatory domain-containing protein [Chryseobacterium polytrichastri]SHK24108.1 CarboxypepD_reg-like domain-containing protein [Chryseobacterium polytrichastri]
MKLLLLFIIILFTGCKSKHYEGYIYDGITKKPILGVQILDLSTDFKTITDKKGHFKIQKNNNISSTLVFQKDLYHTDTISSIQIQNGERQKELFKGDIIYMLKKKDRDSIF